MKIEKEIDLSNSIPPLKVSEDSFIFTDKPTLDMIQRAKEEYKLVVVFVKQPINVLDMKSAKKWGDEFLVKCGITPSSHLIIFLVPNGMEVEKAKKNWIKDMEEQTNTPWKPLSGFKRGCVTSFGGINCFFDNTQVKDNKFTVYGDPGEFSWIVYGKRLTINVEPDKDSVTLFGTGPYQWIE